MWPGQEVFDVTVSVAAKLFGRDVEPLRTKVKLKRKTPATPKPKQEAGSDGKSKQ